MFDVLITTAPKDYNKLPFVCESVMQNIKGFSDFYIVSPTPIPAHLKYSTITYLSDKEALDYDFSSIDMANRRGWYRQQFIKLFQNFTKPNYLVVDSDIYVNKPFHIYPNHPDFYLGKQQNHLPYFECFKMLCGLEKSYDHSFISEMMLFKRGIIEHLLFHEKKGIKSFLDRCVQCINIVNNGSGFSEYEFYGNYVTKNWKSLYHYKKINVLYQHKDREWKDDEIVSCIGKNAKSNYDILTFHTWM